MQPQTDKPVSRTTFWVLLGVSAGLSGLLYLHNRRSADSRSMDDTHVDESEPVAKPEPGDILLFHNAKGLNRLITAFTGSPFYHAALYAGDGKTVEARTPGVLRQDLRGRENDFVVAPAPEGKGRKALAWAETQIGDAYDTIDIAVIILDHLCRFIHFNYTPQNKFSCGEFVAVAFDKADIHLFPERDLGDIVPGDFAPLVPPAVRKRVR